MSYAWATRRAAWESRLHYSHPRGFRPYLTTEPIGRPHLDGRDHYDIIGVLQKTRDYCLAHDLPPHGWAATIEEAVANYRDRYALAVGGDPPRPGGLGVTGYY